MSDLNLFQRLNEIRKKVAYIRKDKEVETYRAVTHDAVTAETRAWFAEFGVLIIPQELSSSMTESGKTKSGTTIYRFEAKYSIIFVNCDKPDDRQEVILTAHALDHGDKAPGKAVSYATKYAVLKVLQIETGENDEGRKTINMAPEDEISEEQLAKFIAGIEASVDVESLKEVYLAASASASNDRDATAALIAAKAKRYRQLVPKVKE